MLWIVLLPVEALPCCSDICYDPTGGGKRSFTLIADICYLWSSWLVFSFPGRIRHARLCTFKSFCHSVFGPEVNSIGHLTTPRRYVSACEVTVRARTSPAFHPPFSPPLSLRHRLCWGLIYDSARIIDNPTAVSTRWVFFSWCFSKMQYSAQNLYLLCYNSLLLLVLVKSNPKSIE